MAVFRRNDPNRPALIAAATRLKIDGGNTEVERIAKRREAWQSQAWMYFDAVGEVKYALNWRANSISKVRLYVAEQEDPEQEPVPTENTAAKEVLAKLRAPVAGYSQLLRTLTLNLDVPGECYLVGLADDGDGNEAWDIYSQDELKSKDGKFHIVDEDGKEKPLSDDDFAARIWLRHPRHRSKPDSTVHGILEPCEDLLIFGKADRAVAKSRIAGSGIMKVPDELSFGGNDPTRDDGKSADEDPFLEELMEAMITPIQDEASASSVVPMVVRGKAEHLAGLEHLTIQRPFDKELDARIERAQKRLVQGIDAPPEIILGLGNANHWGAGQIEESGWNSHLEPMVLVECDALTAGYLRPQLEAAGVQNPEKFLVWYDPSAVIVRPNRSDDADKAHDRLVISDASYRREKGFDEADAITDEAELQRRVARVASPADVPLPNPSAPPEPETEEEAVTAAAPPRRKKSLGRRLTDIDRTLRALILAAADAAMQRALEKAGAKLRSKARKDKGMTAAISGVPLNLVASTLGPGMVAALGVDESELIDKAFDSIQPKFAAWVARAQDEARSLVPAMTAAEHEAVKAQQLRDLDDSWRWLSDSLTSLAKQRLYNPAPVAEAAGETLSNISIPYGLVREAVARAGGGDGIEKAAGVVLQNAGTAPAGGIGTGQVITELFKSKGGAIEGWEWIYGEFPRERPFEPHADLDGLIFKSFTDQELTNSEGWPAGGYFLPGDHDGCVCDVSPAWVIPSDQEEPVPALAAAGG